MTGDCVFLQGKYVEIGIAPNGGFGSTLPAPSGYHPYNVGAGYSFWDPGSSTTTSSSETPNCLGFVADYGRDGWTVGSPPYYGDFYLPGDPQEGWAIQIGATGAVDQAYIPAYEVTGASGFTGGLSGTSLSYSSSGGISKGVWLGRDGALVIRQTTTLDTNKLYFTVNVILTNTGATALNNIYYMRTVDPDNVETRDAGVFTTNNTITYQLPSPGNKVLVSATDNVTLFPQHSYLGLGTKDCRAKCMIFGGSSGGLAPAFSLSACYAGTSTGYYYTAGTSYLDDVGIGLCYNIGTIGAGDSTSLTYTYILNAAYIDSALDATQTTFLVDSANFVSGDSINLCNYGYDTVLVSMGGGAFYQWHWSPDSLLQTDSGTSNVINILGITTPLTYTITGVNVSGGCDTVVSTLTFTHGTFDITLNNVDTNICIGNSVNANVSGPPHLRYQWSPAIGVSDTTVQNPVLTPTVTTTYFVTASSASGCPPVTRHFTINVYTPPTLTIDSSIVKTCTGVGVPLHVYATPSFPYTYSWSPPAYLSSATISNPIATPTSAGNENYVITVGTPVPGCSSTTAITLHTVDPFVLNNNDTIICLGHFVRASITGSTEFIYSWSPATGVSDPSIMNPTITPPVSNEYIVTANYAHCPEMTQSFHIEVDTAAPAYSIVDTICLGMTDSFDFTVAGIDTGSNYYTYSWTPAAEVSNPSIPNPILTPPTLGTNVFSVLVTPHATGCSTTDIVNIYVLPNHISISPVDTMICSGNVLQIVGSGDTHFDYQWIPTAGIGISNVLNALITPDTSAFYTVTATFHRCPAMTATLNLSVQPTPTINVGNSRLLCEYDTLHLMANVSPAWYSGYSYSWSPATHLDNSTSQTVVFDGTASTTLYVTVSTPAGCSTEDSLAITVFPGNFASLTDNVMGFCPQESATLLPTAPAGTSFHWYPSLYLSDSLGSSPVISPITSMTYTVIATSVNGCKDTFNFKETVYPSAVIFLPADSVTLYPGETYQISPGTNCTSFAWFPPEGLSSPNISDPLANPTSSTKYIVTGTTENGCKATDSISIIVDATSLLATPNAFTPGGATNNIFKILKRGEASLNYFRIFDRWGNLMFETNNIDLGWDGSYNGTPQPFGVYIYEIQAVTSDGTIFSKAGNLTLIR